MHVHSMTLHFVLAFWMHNTILKANVLDRNTYENAVMGSKYEIEEIVNVMIETKRNKRSVEPEHYHVLQIQRQNYTIKLHLTKKRITSSDFQFIIKNGDIIEEIHENMAIDCLYSGRTQNGLASIAICGQDGTINGIITEKDEIWRIEPHPSIRKDHHIELEVIEKQSIQHRLRRSLVEQNSTEKSLKSDELHVPKDKLAEAARQAAEDEKKATESEAASKTKTAQIDEDTDGTFELIGQTFDIDETNAEEAEAEIFASKRRKKSSKSSNMVASGKKKIVELAVFTDPEFYKGFKLRYQKDTDKKLREYVLTIINGVDLLYEQKSLGTDLIFKLVRLEVLKNYPSKLKKIGKSAKGYLESFCKYAGTLNKDNAMWDHGLMLTGGDLREGLDTATAGLAWAGTMCLRYYSCSVSESLNLGAVYVIAHELGHSMGMDHDGSGRCKNCDKNKFLMSPTTGSGKIKWSPCSSKNLKDFIEKGSSDFKGIGPLPTCLSKSHHSTEEIDYKGGQLPGMKYNAKAQCNLYLGKKFTPYIQSKAPFNNPCQMLYCGNKTHVTSSHAALEGTQCARGKVCRHGVCTSK